MFGPHLSLPPVLEIRRIEGASAFVLVAAFETSAGDYATGHWTHLLTPTAMVGSGREALRTGVPCLPGAYPSDSAALHGAPRKQNSLVFQGVVLVDLTGESSNRLFETFAEWSEVLEHSSLADPPAPNAD